MFKVNSKKTTTTSNIAFKKFEVIQSILFY